MSEGKSYHKAVDALPSDWNIGPITDATDGNSKSTTIGPFGSDLVATDYRAEGVPVVFVRDVKANRFRWNSDVYVDAAKARQLAAHSVRSRDIIATKMGLPPCVACIYPDSMDAGVITADIIRLRPCQSRAIPQWASLFINSNAVTSQVAAITAGVTRPKITLRDFRTLQFAFPPIPEQRKIASILTTVDSLIEQAEALIEKYRRVKQGMMADLLSRGVDSDGKLRHTQQQAPELYKQSELGWIPREWELTSLGDAANVIDPNPNHRYPPTVRDGVPIASTENCSGNSTFTLSTCRPVSWSVFEAQQKRCQYKPSDVVFARKGRLGLARPYGMNRKVFSHTVVILKSNDEQRLNNAYLLWYARSHGFFSELEMRMNTNSGVPTLGIGFLEASSLPLPDVLEQERIAEAIEQSESCIEQELKHVAKLRTLKTGLMRLAFDDSVAAGGLMRPHMNSSSLPTELGRFKLFMFDRAAAATA